MQQDTGIMTGIPDYYLTFGMVGGRSGYDFRCTVIARRVFLSNYTKIKAISRKHLRSLSIKYKYTHVYP